jgi:GT2 family glycosyltransferase
MTDSDLSLWWQASEEDEVLAPISSHHHVSVVLINKNGEVWQPDTLRGIGSQSRRPDFFAAVDCASKDDSRAGLLSLFEVQDSPAGLSLGEVLNNAIAALPEHPELIEWVWILHDDSAPYAHALAELLRAADANPQAAVFGAKLVDWKNPNHVLEIGSKITGIGTRFTGLEVGERDQGQHDDIERALVVNSAGMLIRRDVWKSLGGFTTHLPHFRVDAEFCLRVWESGNEVLAVPRSRIRHVAATARSIRKPAKEKGTTQYLDRRAGMQLVLSRSPRKLLWLRLVMMLLSAIGRGAGYLLLQDLAGARDEWRAALSLFFSPLPAQRLHAAKGEVPIPAELKPTFKEQAQHLVVETGNGIANTWNQVLEFLFPNREFVSDVGRAEAFRAVLRRPGTLLTLIALSVGSFLTIPNIQGSQLVTNAGVIPTSANLLWTEFLSDWHAVGIGSYESAHPMQALLAMMSVLTSFNPEILVERLLVLGPWLAAISMHLGLRSLIKNAPTRVWLAALYGFSPALLFAIGIGDIGTVLIAILLPWLLNLVVRTGITWREAGVIAIINSIFIMIWPALWIVAVVIFARFAYNNRSSTEVLGRLAFAVFAPIAILLPWSLNVLRSPEMWFSQFGYAGDSVPVWSALLGVGNFDSSYPWWLNIPLILVAVATLIDRRHSYMHTQLWALFAMLLAVGLIGQVLATLQPDAEMQSSLVMLSAILFGLLVISLASAASYVSLKLQRSNFGWRQLVTIGIVGTISLIPVASVYAANQLSIEHRLQARDPIDAEVLRGFTEDLRLRTLYIESGDSGTVRAWIMDGRAPTFADAEVQARDAENLLAERVLNWLTQSTSGLEDPLLDLGIGYIATPFGDEIETFVSSRGNLERVITARNPKLLNVWRAITVPARVNVVGSTGLELGIAQFDTQKIILDVKGVVGPSEEVRYLKLAERSSASWNAVLGGVRLKPQSGDLQSWVIPVGANGELEVAYFNESRLSILLISWFTIGVALVMIAPRRRHIYRDEWMSE